MGFLIIWFELAIGSRALQRVFHWMSYSVSTYGTQTGGREQRSSCHGLSLPEKVVETEKSAREIAMDMFSRSMRYYVHMYTSVRKKLIGNKDRYKKGRKESVMEQKK